MSDMPPIATKAVSRSEASRCAKSGLLHRSKTASFNHLVSARAVVSGTVRLRALAVERRTHCDLGAIIAGAVQSFGRISTTNRRSGTFVLFCAVCARFPVSKKYSPAL